MLEFVIALYNPPYGKNIERWGTVVCDFAVALGVVGETLFAARSTSCQDALTRRSNDRLAIAARAAGEANERAAKAELELAKYRSRRTLEDNVWDRIVEKVAHFGGTTFFCEITRVDADIIGLIGRLQFALICADWVNVEPPWPGERAQSGCIPSAPIAVGAAIDDVLVAFPMDDEKAKEAAIALVGALNAEGIAATWALTNGTLVSVTVGPKR